MKQLQIFSPDGQSRCVALESERIALGRATNVELSFPDDSGLSRQHFAIEREGDRWALLDLGSKNGTMLNGVKVTGRMELKAGDRIAAGHLVIVCDGGSRPQQSRPVVVFDASSAETDKSISSAVVTRLDGVIRSDGYVADPHLLAASHVSALIRAGNELAGNRPLPELFRFILDLAIEAVQADRGVLIIAEEDELVVRAHKGDGFRISSAVRDRVLNSGHSILVRDTSLDDALRERRSIVEQRIRTLMAVPLQTREKIIGIIYVDSPSLLREFTKDDLNLLTVMANVAAIRIEHTRFAEMEQARQLLARDLEQAAEIQKGFLPSVAPTLSGLELAGHNAPCHTVGGDYFDFFPYENGRVAMVLGDVSGKGMPASLLMMGLQARVQVLIEEPGSLADVVSRLNRVTSANLPSDRFITLFLCILDGQSGELTFCNAGHNPPVIVRADGTHRILKFGGPVLGIIASMQYEQYRELLEPGDLLVIYSDGVTEAVSPAGEEFDVKGLIAAVVAARHEPAQTIIQRINEAVSAHTGGAPQSDDVTLIVARRK